MDHREHLVFLWYLPMKILEIEIQTISKAAK